MGEENTVSEAAEATENGTSLPEKNGEAVTEKKEVQNGVKDMEEDKDDEKAEAGKMDEEKESKEENGNGKAEEPKTEAMEEDTSPNEKEVIEEKGEAKDEVEEKGDATKKEEGQDEEKAAGKAGKGSKKRVRGKNAEKVKEKTREVKEKKKELEPRTPAIDRPVRERKSVERLVASIEKEVVKEFHFGKGPGTALKDIPNVAFKLSRKRTDDTFKLLHTVLFGRRGKAFQVKNNISRFSGFVWHDNEERQKIKIKEKFDKCHKVKLVEICDVPDITVSKASTRKTLTESDS